MIKKIGKILIIIVLGLLVFIIGKFLLVWDGVEVDHSLSKRSLFKTFDRQKQETIWSKRGIKSNDFKTKMETDSLSPEYYECAIHKNPILTVRLYVGDGFSGGGFQIDILQNRYKISPYSYTDNIKPFDFLDTGEYYKVLDSKLILDKESYKEGDSIFGYTELKVQRRYGPEKYTVEGKGYFKGIVN
ncbi:hypothetical protein DBR39_15610 [Chryseobacterium sp. KBW03]|uniref:hypothetical protein n=1 Tax=Chryseobacterium sp. KBW03 TaxID=2153362 RepID=UPI000F5914AF|nr:hypothetical protein [Chryseobacterium sp. KBW03]RQO38291.1 hypothetical protein DBR39_15610 [Chryseobacterium sp. KBW03]